MNETVPLFDTSRFMPHGHCFLWQPDLLWSMVGADAVIALSYYSIPAALLYGLRRQPQPRPQLNWVVVMFVAFIFACGTTHLLDIYTIWQPNYWLDAGAKMVTGVASAATAIALWPLVRRGTAYLNSTESSAASLADANLRLTSALATLQRQQEQLHLMNRMSGLLQVARDFGEMYQVVSDTLQRLLPEASGALYVREGDGETLTRVAHWGQTAQVATIRARDCWSSRLNGRFPDSPASRIRCDAAGCGVQDNRHCLPVSGGGELLGVLVVEGIEVFGDEINASLLDIMAERLSLALQSMRLRQDLEYQSTRDPLTGLHNRRYLDEALAMEERRAERSGEPLSVILFDLDRLKQINDTWGHEAGDLALEHFAAILREHVRAGDIACRYGGEEFLVVMPRTTLDAAGRAASRIGASLTASVREASAPGLRRLTVSGGVASLPRHGSTAAEVIRRADEALYAAKAAGRNGVVTADSRHCRGLAPTGAVPYPAAGSATGDTEEP